MGRIKTQLVKRVSIELHRKHRDQLKNSFEENKDVVRKYADIRSKKLLNTVSGYVTRLVKEEKEI